MIGDIIVGAAKGARDALDYWTLGATIVGVLILAIYTAAALWQATLTNAVLTETRRSNEAIQKSNELTAEGNRMQREALIAASRARLSITSGPYNAPLAAGATEIVFNLKNAGLGCATDVIVKSGHEIFDKPLEDCSPLNPTTLVLRRASFPPGANAALHFGCGSLSEKDASDLNEQRRWLYVLGIITYEDGTGSARETKVCAYYLPNPNSPAESTWELTHFCNTAT
jgi:hypothetical protein